MKSSSTKNNDNKTTSSQPFFGPQAESSFFGEDQKQDKAFFDYHPVQTKLTVGAPNDPSEREADAIADQVVRKSQAESQDPAPRTSRPPSKSSLLQTKRLADTITPLSQRSLQPKPAFESPGVLDSAKQSDAEETPLQQKIIQASEANTKAPANLESQLADRKGQGSPMDADTRSRMESGFGADFSGVRVHNNDNAVQMNRSLGSKAFTHRNDIYFDKGQYQPGAEEGDRLLAHELTHTIQQGASGADRNIQTKAKVGAPAIQLQPGDAAADLPITPEQLEAVDISSNFRPNPKMEEYLNQNAKKKVEVPVKVKDLAQGKIFVKQTNRPKEGETPKYIIYDHQGLSFTGIDFLNKLKGLGAEPVIALVGNSEQLSGFISLRVKDKVLPNPKKVIEEINKYLEPLGLLGIEPLQVPAYDNKVEGGILTFMVNDLSTTVAGFLDASGSFGMVGGAFVFELNTQVDVQGLAQGDFTIKRNENGAFSGEGEIAVAIANLNGKVKVTYAAGDVTILGSVGIESEKFSGQITVMVADKVTADQTMKAELGVESLEEEKKDQKKPKAPEKKTKQNQVVVGWGQVTARITSWLEGTAKVGIDSKGQVTVIGEIVVPEEVILMEQKGKKINLFELEIQAGYGVPLVGQIGFFASIGMFINAGFGPLVLRNVSFTGTYSTDPSVLQNFTITGTLGLNAFVIIGLEAKAGVFVTLIGHDIKAGIKVTAEAGLKAYAEATPVFEYIEKADPAGGKVGESRLKGHFEAAAQLFLKLAGSFFVELDSPWWSPAPDKTWDWPLGDVEYPIGPSMGIGGDVDWLVGSEEPPELKFSPVEFDPDKFTADIMADPPPGKGGGKGGEQKGDGKWEDQSQKADKDAEPEVKKGEGLKDTKKQDLTKLPEQERYMRGLGELGDLGDAAKKKPITFSVLQAKARKVKSKYALGSVLIKDKQDTSAKVYVKQGKHSNDKHPIEVKLMSEAERMKLVQKAVKDLEARQASKADPKAQTIKEADAQAIAAEVSGQHYVVESIKVVDGKASWDYVLDLGDQQQTIKGKGKQEAGEGIDLAGLSVQYKTRYGENHKLVVRKAGNKFILKRESSPELVRSFLQDQETNIEKAASLDNEEKKDKKAEITKALPLIDQWTAIAEDKTKKPAERRNEILNVLNQLKAIMLAVDLKTAQVPSRTPSLGNAKADDMTIKYIYIGHGDLGQDINAYKGNLSGAMDILNDYGIRSQWIQFHILNHEMGGPAVEANLIPTTDIVNIQYKNFEREMKKLYARGEVLWLKAKIDYHAELGQIFPSSYKATANVINYEQNTGNWQEVDDGNTLEFERSGPDTPLPSRPEGILMINKIDEANIPELARKFNIWKSVLTIIANKGAQSKKELVDLIKNEGRSERTITIHENRFSQIDIDFNK